MSGPLGEHVLSLPAAALGRLDDICDAYEAAWRADGLPQIEATLAGAPPELHARLFRELLLLDRELRRAADAVADEGFYRAALPSREKEIGEIFRAESEAAAPQFSTPSAFDTQTGRQSGRPLPSDLPQTIGKYRVVAWLGSGGQGDVLRAIHPTLNRDVVIKIGRRRVAEHQAEAAALLREGRALAELNHPNLVRVFDLDFHDGRPYLVLDLVDGESLRKKLTDHRLPPVEAAAIVAQIARAVVAVHERGLVHLDIKPDNIVVDGAGVPYLVDFGLAILPDVWSGSRPSDGQFRGTPAFAAPEQAAGNVQAIGPRTDVFGLGALLYNLVTGEPPYCGAELVDVLRRARACEVDRTILWSRAPRQLAAMCLRAMSARPADRFASAADMAEALERWQTRRPGRTVAVVLIAALLLAVTIPAALAWKEISRNGDVLSSGEDVADVPERREGTTVPASAAPAAPVAATDQGARPQWNQETGELRIDGEVIRRVQRSGTNIIEVLNAFERQGWPERIENPFANDWTNKKLQGTCSSLKDGLQRIRFSTQGGYIYWTREG